MSKQLTFDEVSNNYRQWLLKIAHQYSRDKTEVYDFAQEGHIAMWKAYNTYTGEVPLKTHLMNHARWRMIEVCQRRNFTGTASRQGKKHTAGTEKNVNRELPVDTTLSDYDVLIEEDFDSCVVAYHHGDIHRAIDELSPKLRERVYDKFWRGIYNPRSASWWEAKNGGAKYLLREKLEHLRGVI